MYVLKMVITGPFAAGKTQFIRSISEIDVVSTERTITDSTRNVKRETTVAMDFGRITVDDELVLHLYGTPGQKRFDFMWEILSEGMLGFIVLVDSSRPETFRDTLVILDTFLSYRPAPYVIAATKQDHPDAWSTDDIRVALNLDCSVKVLPCVAIQKESVKAVLLELMYSILDQINLEEQGQLKPTK